MLAGAPDQHSDESHFLYRSGLPVTQHFGQSQSDSLIIRREKNKYNNKKQMISNRCGFLTSKNI